MCILDKYIIKNFLLPFFYCLALFLFLFIIIDLFGNLDEILKHSVPILILDEYYLSLIPFIILHTAPIAALLSSMYVISSLNKYDEITAMRAAGINMFRILIPFVVIGLIISVGVFFVTEKILPVSMKNAQSIKKNYIEKQKKHKDLRLINNIALYSKKDRLIFIESYDVDGYTAHGITILEQNKNGNVIKKINAQEGKWINGSWTFSNVLIYKLGERGMVSGIPLFFKEKEITLENPRSLISKGTGYQFMSFKDLSNYLDNFANVSPRIVRRLRVDLHQKTSLPFTNLIIIIIGVAFGTRIRRRGKATVALGIGLSIVIGFIYYVSMATCIALGKGGFLPPIIAAHLANIVFGITGLVLIKN